MFGMGGSEILVILIVALLFLGPDKLPEAARQISKGIRDLRGASREIQETIENDEHIGGAVRDIKSALRGDEIKPRPKKQAPLQLVDEAGKPILDASGTPMTRPGPGAKPKTERPTPNQLGARTGKVPKLAIAVDPADPADDDTTTTQQLERPRAPDGASAPVTRLTLPATAGESDPMRTDTASDQASDTDATPTQPSSQALASLIRPAPGIVAKATLAADERAPSTAGSTDDTTERATDHESA